MSERTLQRRLQDEGVTFAVLLDEVTTCSPRAEIRGQGTRIAPQAAPAKG